MPIVQDGTFNSLATTNPGTYADIIPPAPSAVGSPTNAEAFVGVASWGQVGAVASFASPAECTQKLGAPLIRRYDLATGVAAAYGLGNQTAFKGLRVSDGTDTAATASLPAGAGEFVAACTGVLGNGIRVSFAPTALAGAFAALVQFPGANPERYDGVAQALAGFATSPGAGYQSVPALKLSAPSAQVSTQAIAQATLVAVSATLKAGGTGHAVGDVVQLGAGVAITVTQVAAGAIVAANVTNAGLIASGMVPALVGAQTSSTGAGVGASFALSFGLGQPNVVNPGFGYVGPIVATVIGGNPTTAGALTPSASFWAALAVAVNAGTAQRGRSSYVTFSAGPSTAVPAVGVVYALSGGTDGDAGVTDAVMMGADNVAAGQRTGMYALAGSKLDFFTLMDVVDHTLWPAQLAFALANGCGAVVADAASGTIEEAVALRTSVGVDSPSIWILVGDYPSFYDEANGLVRQVYPGAIALGLLGNLSPEQSPINKPLVGVVGTQTSAAGFVVSSPEESIAQTGGVDVIGRSVDLDEDYWTFLTGRNASSNTAANGIEYVRLTNYLARLISSTATRSIVGRLQSIRADDPTRERATNILNNALANEQSPAAGDGDYGKIDVFSVQCDLTNNPPPLQALGFLFAFVRVRYLNVVRYFIVQMQGGGNVTVTVQSTAPTLAQITPAN